ncbi:MAG TPA: D-2-hydroxyacid dehydrogenase [Gemmataceae bacterium]|nr:D-2-hydroxyacid dehydrogenase [Gemmataceae bacterium]
MTTSTVLILEPFPDTLLRRLTGDHPQCNFVDGRAPESRERMLKESVIVYGLPPLDLLAAAGQLRWLQMIYAGVPQDLCPLARERGWAVTNMAGLYGPSIAEHAIAMMLVLSRNLHVVQRNQIQSKWDRTVMTTMRDLHGKTLALVGLGNIGQNIARLAKAHGMRVIGCRRTNRTTPFVDQLFPISEVPTMVSQAEYVAVAAPLTRHTEGMLGPKEFAAMKPGTIYINVSRGAVAQEKAFLDALNSGPIAAAGLDVFAVEPLPADHAFWSMPQVLVSPHFSGEIVNQSSLPAERFVRNLTSWFAGEELEGRVNLDFGY